MLVVEDHSLVREGMTLLLARLGAEWQVREAASLDAALEILAQQPIELLVLDHFLPDGHGVRAIADLRARAPDMKILVVSAANDPRTVREAIDAGARGYVPKSSPSDVLLGAVRLVLAGSVYIPHEVLATVSTDVTDRQREILRHLIAGKLNQEIATLLLISESTIRAELTTIYRALGARNRAHAVQLALQRRLV